MSKLELIYNEAINLFYAQVELQKGLSFVVNVSNALTIQVPKHSKQAKEIESFDSKKLFLRILTCDNSRTIQSI